MAETFTCAHCGGTFEKGWSDEEAAAENEELWGDDPANADQAIICDDCYRKFMRWWEKGGRTRMRGSTA